MIREMITTTSNFISTEKSIDQISAGELLSQDEKVMLLIANGNSMLHASLILLTLMLIFFTLMKICKLCFQIRESYREKQVV